MEEQQHFFVLSMEIKTLSVGISGLEILAIQDQCITKKIVIFS